MLALILGAPGTGKSTRGEALALRLAGDGPRVYLATMVPFGAEGAERVARHRQAREGKGFMTVERPTDVGTVASTVDGFRNCVCLLECAANLVGNERHAPENVGLDDDAIVAKLLRDTLTLATASKGLVVVSNTFAEDSPEYDDSTRRYVRLLNRYNARVKELADYVAELVDGEWRTDEHF